MANGVEGPEHEEIQGIVFSADGRRLAYVAVTRRLRKLKSVAVVDEVEGPQYDTIMAPVFHDEGEPEYLAVRAGSLYRVRRVPVGQ